MNKIQKRILFAVAVVIVAMLVYPPLQSVRNGTVYNMGYGWIFALSKRGYMTINVSMLLIQWVGVFVVGGLAFFLSKNISTGESDQHKKVLADTSDYDDTRLKSNDVSDHQIPSIKVSLWNWKSLIIAFVIAFIINIFAANIAGTKPAKNIIWTVWWIYLTIEAWKYWKWKALLPFPIYLFVLTIGYLFLESAGVKLRSIPGAILVIVSNMGGLAIFYMLLNRERSSLTPETSVNKDAEIENIIRDAELRSTQKFQNIAITKSETKQQNEEFIALLKSSINENGLKTIPGDDLIEIYKRAKSIESSYGIPSLALSVTINAVLEEIKKRGLSPDVTLRDKISKRGVFLS